MAQAQVQKQELTHEQILIQRLVEEAREDLQRLDVSKKERIRRLAEDLDSTGITPTNMIADVIGTKLKDCLSRAYITEVLDSKYKNQNLARNVNVGATLHPSAGINSPSNIGTESVAKSSNAESSVYDYNYNLADYGACFDIADCHIESWDKYSDSIKKKWVIRLIEDKERLQREVLSLQATIAKLEAR